MTFLMSERPSWAVGVLAATVPVCIAATVWTRREARRHPLPPSPPLRSWFGGHGYLMPKPGDKELFWQVFTKLARVHGDIMYLSIDGEDTIILSSYEAINELFNIRGSKYSHRQIEPWFTDIMGWGKITSFSQYDNYWRETRRLTNIGFNKQAAASYHGAQAKHVGQFLQRIVTKPDEWEKELDRMIAAIIMQIVYGYPVNDSSDPIIKVTYEALNSLQCLHYTPSWIMSAIKRFPVLCSLPSWLPGMGWKRRLLKERHWPNEMAGTPWKWTTERIAAGNAPPSFASQLLEMNQNGSEGEDTIKWLSGTMFSAGSHTSAGTTRNFILAMVLHPDVVKRAQEEIDRVVGTDRLPGMADQPKLVYAEAVLLEVLRWRNMVPLGLPHRITVEDEYNGYRIPAGSIVIGNVHSIMHNENLFPEPHLFKPERFLPENKNNPALSKSSIDPRDLIFGIGRRSCPGFRVALATLYLTVTNMLATMDFGRAEGDEGELDVGCVSGLVAMPLSFKCSIKPRSEAAIRLINETVLFGQE